MTRRQLLSLISLCWILGLAHAIHSWPRGGAWFGRRGNGKEKGKPTTKVVGTSQTNSNVNETKTTVGGGIKGSTKSSPLRKNDKKKMTRHARKIRKKRRNVAAPVAVVGYAAVAEERDNLEEGQSRGRSTTRSRRPKDRHRTTIIGESKKIREKAIVGPDQTPIRSMKKRKKDKSSLTQDQQSNSDMVMLRMTVTDDDNIVERKHRPIKRGSKGNKRPDHNSAIMQVPSRSDVDGLGYKQASGDMELSVRSKKLKKKKAKEMTTVQRVPQVTVSDDDGEMNLHPKKSKKKRVRSKVKGESKIGRVHPNAKDALDSVDKVQHKNRKMKSPLKKKKKKAKTMKHHKAPVVLSEGRVDAQTGQEVSVEVQEIGMIRLLDSANFNVDDAMNTSEPMDDGKPSELSQRRVLDNDPCVRNAVGEADQESLADTVLSSELHALEIEQGEKVSDESIFSNSQEYESQMGDRRAVPAVDEAVAAPPNEEDSADLQDNDAHDLTVLENQDDNYHLELIKKESLQQKDQDPEQGYVRDTFNQLNAHQELFAEVAIDGDHIANVYHTLKVDHADDNDALDELVEALIQDQLDESEVPSVVAISENERIEKSFETSEESVDNQEKDVTVTSGARSLPLRSLSNDDSVEGRSELFDTEDQGYTTENPVDEEADHVVGESLTHQTNIFTQNNIDYDLEEYGGPRVGINMYTNEQDHNEMEETMSVLKGVPDQTDDFLELRAVTYEDNLAGDAIEDVNDTDESSAPKSIDVHAVANDEDDVEAVAGLDVDVEEETVEVDPVIVESKASSGQEFAKNDKLDEGEEEDALEADGKHMKGGQAMAEPDVVTTPDVIQFEAITPLDKEVTENDVGTEIEVNVRGSELEISDFLGSSDPSSPQLVDPTQLEDEEQLKKKTKENQHGFHEMDATQTSLDINESPTSAWQVETEDTPELEAESVRHDQDDRDQAATRFPPRKVLDESVSGGQAELVKTDVKSMIESSDDPSDITVSVVSWNLAEAVVPEEDAAFIRKFRKTPSWRPDGEDGTDIVLISSQECENIKPRRSEGHRSRELRRLMIKMLGKNYIPLAIHSLGGIQFGLFCKRSILSEIEFVSVADVTCGIGNVFHNKGAIAAFLQMKSRDPAGSNAEHATKHRAKSVKMLFVTAHLAAHVKNVDARNMDYWRIASELQAQAPSRFLPPKQGLAQDEESNGSGSHLIDSVDRIFFCGDLNYRLDLPREIAENSIMKMKQLLKAGDAESLRKAEELRLSLLLHDQLRQVLAQGAAFPGFAEGKITFMPTFKFDKETSDYDTSHKQRIPAWTDRVLFKPFGTRVLEYTSEEDSKHSDHRPVHATFRVSTLGREVTGPRKGTRQRARRTTKKQRNRP